MNDVITLYLNMTKLITSFPISIFTYFVYSKSSF